MTPDLMKAGAQIRVEHERKIAATAGQSGGRETSYSRIVTPGALDVAHGAILYLDDITVSFDGFKALNALSLSISAGEMRCIIGPNGAGKTTMSLGRPCTSHRPREAASVDLSGQAAPDRAPCRHKVLDDRHRAMHDEPTHQVLQGNGIRMHVAVQGRGPLVLCCHGWPETGHSWRHQLAALAAAGYRAVAPDMRGYGNTDAPEAIDQYTLLHLVGDMVALVHSLGEVRAVIVGHDWGAPVAWHAALLRPDLFHAVVGMSVPYAPPHRTDLLSALEAQGTHTFYMQYFQTPGVAEAELERDVPASLRRIYFSASGDRPGGGMFGLIPPGQGFLDRTIDPEVLPAWLPAEDLAHVAQAFRHSGFRGGLNWYRNLRRSSELLAPWRGCAIRQPSMFIAGARDAVLKFPGFAAQIDHFGRTLPGLRGSHLIEGAGHWVQRERADAVNALLLDFLDGLTW